MQGADQIEAQSKAFSSVSITLTEYFESLESANNMLVEYSITSDLAIVGFVLLSQCRVLCALFGVLTVFVYFFDALIARIGGQLG